ncbi:MAG: glycosyltransferase [Verrucomicrobiales bacterium]|jgi:alpha-1,6-mannosyltransferase|nr:glycosyltransferase [Verrucomicrobiales bacterium]
MKICDATQFYSEVGGGVRRYLTEKRRYLLRHTAHEHVLIIPGERTETVNEGRLTTCTVASPKINRTSRYRILFNLKQAAQMVYEQRPDIIESGDPYQLGWRMIQAGAELRVPVVGFYHSHFPEAYLRTALKYCGPWLREVGMAYAQDYIRRLYNTFDRTLVPSVYLADLLRQWGVRRAAAVQLGVDTEIFRPGAADADGTRTAWRQQLGVADEAILLLYVGRLAGEKNTGTLVEAFKLLARDAAVKFELLIIGDGAQRPLVLAAQRTAPRLHWRPYCANGGELAGYYRAADLFVHPGVCETFGLVALESQACGCPVVGIRGSYMDANIFAGLEHWAAENTPAALAAAIRRYATLDRRALGATAAAKVLAEYSWARSFEKILAGYEREIAD